MGIKRFDELNISQEVLRSLANKGFETATRIQAEAIPPLLEWRDIIAKAPTGTGKTFAFGIPLVEHIDLNNDKIQALILAPTRELALQICDEMRSLLLYKNNIRIVTIYGGQSIGNQIKALKRNPQIVVATPGRLMDHVKRRTIRLDSVSTVVLDEADRMLDMGFIDEVTKIIELTKNRRNMALLSATVSQEVMTISWKYQRDEVEITVPADEENKPDIVQYRIDAVGSAKAGAVLDIIKNMKYERILTFCNTKIMVRRLTEELSGKGYRVDCIHGDIKQSLREKVMSDFRNGKLDILIATDVASRGIDVDDVDCVINYDIPDENEYYTHRIGRTGRAKRHGVAFSLIGNLVEKAKLDEIAKYAQFTVTPVQFGPDGALEIVEEKRPPQTSRRKFR